MTSSCLTLLFLCFNAFCFKKNWGQLSYFTKHENQVQGGNSKKKSFHAFLCMMCVSVKVKLHGITMKDRYNELTLNSSLCWETKGEDRTTVHKAAEKNLERKESHEQEYRAPKRAWWRHSQFNVPPAVTRGKRRVTFTSTHYVYEESSHGYYKGVHHISCHTHWFLNCAQRSPGFHCLEISKTIPSFCNENSICVSWRKSLAA